MLGACADDGSGSSADAAGGTECGFLFTGDQAATTIVVPGRWGLFLEQSRTVVRVGGDVAIIEPVVFQPTADRLHELVRAAVSQLDDVREEAG